MKALFLCVVLMIMPRISSAEWRVTQGTDELTDKPYSHAWIENDAGHRLTVRRQDDGTVWAIFRLSKSLVGVLDSSLGIAYRVDKLKAVNVRKDRELERRVGVLFVMREPSWIGWRIFSGKGAANHGSLRDLMNGTEMLVRFYLFQDGARDTRFSLVGAKEAISEALNIPAEPDVETAQREQAYNRARSAAMEQCNALPIQDLGACMKKWLVCGKREPTSVAAFAGCLQER